jgi:transcription elongation factor Elf1
MSKESLLNREFTEREVTRMRNLITKKHGDKTQISAGYEKNIKREENEIWEADGKTWTIKNGIKRSVPKLSKFKQEAIMPLTCPKCNNPLSRQSDFVKHLYKMTGHCPKCQARYESDLKLAGKFEEYAKEMHAKNHLHAIDEAEKGFDDFVQNGFEQYMSELGETEDWVGNSISPEQIKEAKEYFKSQRDKISTYLSEINKQ